APARLCQGVMPAGARAPPEPVLSSRAQRGIPPVMPDPGSLAVPGMAVPVVGGNSPAPAVAAKAHVSRRSCKRAVKAYPVRMTTPPDPGPDNAVTLGILAGGRAPRLGGRDKAWLERAGQPLVLALARRLAPEVDATFVSANRDVERYRA